MKRFVSYVATGMLAGALAVPGFAIAQTGGANNAAGGPVIINSGGAPTSDLPMKQYNEWDEFREDHADISHALARNPKLINNESYQRRHPPLRDFLSNHPDFAEDFVEHPGDYVVPAHVRVQRRHNMERHDMERHAARTENGKAQANATTGGMNAGAEAGANAPSNSADAHANANASSNSADVGPNGVPAATGEAAVGNSGAGAPAGASSKGSHM